MVAVGALVFSVLSVTGMFVGYGVDRSVRQTYSEALLAGTADSAIVASMVSTKQRKTIVGLDVNGVRRTVDITTDSNNLSISQHVTVHRGVDDPALLAIEGTAPWTWWGTMTTVFATGGAVSAMVGLWAVTGRRPSASRSASSTGDR